MKLPAGVIRTWADVQRNFDRLRQKVPDSNRGTFTVSFPGGGAVYSATQTVSHGLGVTPRVVHPVCQDSGVPFLVGAQAFNLTPTTFDCRAFYVTSPVGTPAPAGVTGPFVVGWTAEA